MWACIKYILLSKSALNSILFWSHLYKCIWNCGTWDTHKCYTFIWRPSKYSIKRVMCVCVQIRKANKVFIALVHAAWSPHQKSSKSPPPPFCNNNPISYFTLLVYYSSSTPPAHILFPKSANWSGMVQPWVLPDILSLHWFLFKLKHLISLLSGQS